MREIFPTDPSAPTTKHPLPFNLLELYIELGVIAFQQNSAVGNQSSEDEDISMAK